MTQDLTDAAYRVFATCALAALAVAGNYFHLPLLFGLDFIFGSIAVMLAVLLLGTLPAVIVAIAGGLYTLVLWGVPYPMVVFVIEALIVSLLYRRWVRNIVLADLLYWLFLGIPLVLLFYRGVIGMDWEPTTMIALKQGVNALFNTLIASLLLMLWRLSGRSGQASGVEKPSLASLLFHAMLPLTLLAGTAPILHESYTQRIEQEAFMAERLGDRAQDLVSRLETDYLEGRERYDYHLARVQTREDLVLAIVSTDGHVLASRGDGLITSDGPEGSTELRSHGLSIWLPGGSMSAVARWGRGFYFMTVPVAAHPRIDRVHVQLPAAQVVRALEQHRVTLFGLLTAIIALAILVSAGLSHAISRPLRKLETVSEGLGTDIAAGRSPTLPNSRIFEYDSLAETLRDMSLQLGGSFRQLAQSQAELESQVRERTAEVARTAEQLQAVLAAASDFSVIATDRNGVISLFNKGSERMLGYAADELIGKHTPALFHLESEVATRASELSTELERPVQGFRVFVEIPEQAGSETREWSYIRKDGGRLPVSLTVTVLRDAKNDIVGYLGIAADITERIQIQSSLAEQAKHTQAILDNMVDGIITIDESGVIHSWNPAATRIFGFHAEEVIGRNVNMLMPSPHREAHDGYLQAYRRTGIARIIGIGREVEGQRRDGSLFPMELAVSEITRQDRTFFVGMVRDISERKRMERMKTEFVSTVSHELRTPLTAISGALGLIAGEALGEIPDRVREMTDIAYKNSQRLTHLINDLLDMEKIAAGKMRFAIKEQTLTPLIEQALESHRTYGGERQIQLILANSCTEAKVRVDGQRLMQVMANLLSNAIKFSREGGVVRVSVEPRSDRVRVSIKDQGAGVPPEFQDRIFEKFAQADSSDSRAKGGTGLGLAITRELVERMGGCIGFDSAQGLGATFWFELPLIRDDDELEQHPIEQPPADFLPDSPRILVVEDEPDVAKLLAQMLARGGYRVDVVHNGAEALSALGRNDYDALCLDVMLPDMSGLEIIHRLRATPETATLPIVVVSARLEDGRLALSGDCSHTDWLAKPVHQSRLLAAIDAQLASSTQLRPRVLHVEDDPDLHKIIRTMVGARFDVEVATSLHQARELIGLERFEVVVLDIKLPDGSGWDLLPEIRARQPEAKIVVLSGSEMTEAEAAKVESALLKSRIYPQELLDALSSRLPKRTRRT